jgi:hypothetical protein
MQAYAARIRAPIEEVMMITYQLITRFLTLRKAI